MRGDVIGAIGDADYAIELRPRSSYAYYSRGLINARLGLWASATADFKAATWLDPGTQGGAGNYMLGVALILQGQYLDAVASLSRTIGNSKLAAPAYFQRARAYEKLGDVDPAISDMNAIIQTIPAYPEAYHRRAHLLMRKGIYRAAIDDLAVALSRDAGDVFATHDLAHLCGSGVSVDDCRSRTDFSPGAPLDHAAHFGFSP